MLDIVEAELFSQIAVELELLLLPLSYQHSEAPGARGTVGETFVEFEVKYQAFT